MAFNGLIDLHIHGTGRYGTGNGSAEDVIKMAETVGRVGVSGILPAIYPAPVKKMRECMAAVREAMGRRAEKGLARVLGVHLEGPFLSPMRSGALKKDVFLSPSLLRLKELISGFEDVVKIITVAPELKGALKIIERCVEMGIRVNMGHSDATLSQALEGKRAGASGVTHLFNAMRPFHLREPGLAGLGLMDEDLYIEVIADGVHLSPEVLRFVFDVKQKDRIILVSDSVTGPMRRKGVLQGSKTGLSEAVKILNEIGIPKKLIIKAARENPEKYLGLWPL
jgi:N-acetylglucosamine-6-phosphate deacetylase